MGYHSLRELALNGFRRRYFAHILRRTNGNVSQAAKKAGLDRSNLLKSMRQLGIEPNEFRDKPWIEVKLRGKNAFGDKPISRYRKRV